MSAPTSVDVYELLADRLRSAMARSLRAASEVVKARRCPAIAAVLGTLQVGAAASWLDHWLNAVSGLSHLPGGLQAASLLGGLAIPGWLALASVLASMVVGLAWQQSLRSPPDEVLSGEDVIRASGSLDPRNEPRRRARGEMSSGPMRGSGGGGGGARGEGLRILQGVRTHLSSLLIAVGAFAGILVMALLSLGQGLGFAVRWGNPSPLGGSAGPNGPQQRPRRQSNSGRSSGHRAAGSGGVRPPWWFVWGRRARRLVISSWVRGVHAAGWRDVQVLRLEGVWRPWWSRAPPTRP